MLEEVRECLYKGCALLPEDSAENVDNNRVEVQLGPVQPCLQQVSNVKSSSSKTYRDITRKDVLLTLKEGKRMVDLVIAIELVV